MKRIVCLILIMIGLPLTAFAEKAKSLTVTVYHDGRALVNEVRQMALPEGIAPVEFCGVPETIDPATLRVRSLTSPDRFSVLDMHYAYDMLSGKNLLDRYVGKSLKVILPDPRDSHAKNIKDAILLANIDRPVFQVDETIYVGPYEAVLLPEIPKGLHSKPTLVWLVNNRGPDRQDIEVSYLAEKLPWKADYAFKVNRANTQASLSGWVTLTNQSGMAFEDATLKLVAGEIHRAWPEDRLRIGRYLQAAPTAEAVPAMKEEEFFEYHLYHLLRPVDIGNRQTKQLSLLEAPQVKVEKELLSRFSAFYAGHTEPIKQKVEVVLIFENKEKNGLGLPLPKGIVRGYQESQDGSTLLIGEDHIDHTPRDATVRLKMGEAFDLKVERKLTDYQKPGKKIHRFAWQISIKNSKDQPQRVLLQDTLPGEWRILKASHPYEKLDARNIQFDITAPSSAQKGETIVTYEVEVEY